VNSSHNFLPVTFEAVAFSWRRILEFQIVVKRR
jgi:hypothetical protein